MIVTQGVKRVADSDIEKSESSHSNDRKDQGNEDGTLHQSGLGPKARRRHFFSPLDPVLAEAVHLDAVDVKYSLEEEV